MGLEKMALQGLPCDDAVRFTNGQLSDLAGNGFAKPVVATIALCMLVEFSDTLPPTESLRASQAARVAAASLVVDWLGSDSHRAGSGPPLPQASGTWCLEWMAGIRHDRCPIWGA